MTKKNTKKSPQKQQGQAPSTSPTAAASEPKPATPAPVSVSTSVVPTDKSNNRTSNDSEEEDLSPPPMVGTSTTVPIVRCSNVVKVSFGDKSQPNNQHQQGPSSPTPASSKPLVHPSLSSDSLSSIHTNEQLLQQKIAAASSGTSSRTSVSSTSSIAGDNSYNSAKNGSVGSSSVPLSLDKMSLSDGEDEKDLISVSLGDGSTMVTQATTISGTTTSNSVSLDTLSSSISQKRPSPLKQLEIIRQLIEQYNAPNANANQALPSTSTMMAYGYLIHSTWLRDWYDYVSLPKSAAGVKEPRGISNWELIDDKASIENWKSKTSPVLASSVSFTTLLEDQASSPNDQHSEYFNSKFKLRANLQESFDYFILPKDAWEALYRWYGGGPPLPRFFNNALKASPHFPLFYHLLDLLNSNSPMLAATTANGGMDPSVIHRHASREQAEQVMKQRSYLHAIELDVYANSKIPSVRDILDFQAKQREAENSSVEGQGQGLKDGEKLYSVEEASNANADTKVNERIDKPKEEVPTPVATGPCAVCHSKSKTRCSQCSSVFYCSKDCQKVHWQKHKKECKILAAAGEKGNAGATNVISTENKLRGKVGLANMGNSCYMNSSLQCLSHIMPLTNFFISNRYENEINAQNRDGTKGELVRTYAALLQDLWINTPSNVGASSVFARMNALTPKRFKSVLGRLNPDYAGVEQHDAHEVIELLLDKMHEDLNRISKKPYVENLEGDGTNDATIARETWKRHSLRENSMIKDNVGGLMRSQLNCPTCGKVSVAYEYHNTFQIAIPRNYNITVTIVFIPEIPSDRCPPFVDSYSDDPKHHSTMSVIHRWDTFKPRKIAITLDRLCTIKALKKMLKDQGHIPLEFIEMCKNDLIMLESACGTISPPSVGGRKGEEEDGDDDEEDNKNKKKTPSLAVRNTRGKPKSIKVLSDDKTVSIIGAQSIVYCYATCHTQNDLAVVHMRKFEDEDILALKKAVTQGGNDQQINAIMDNIEYFGFPLLISYDGKWPTRRVQYHIWLNIIRFLSTQSTYVQQSLTYLKTSNMMKQFELSDSVHIRAIYSDGKGYYNKYAARGLDAQSQLFGVELCKDPKKATDVFIQEQGLRNFASTGVLAVDFASDLSSLIDINMLEQLELNIVVSANKPGMNRPRVRHNSTILTLEECLDEHTKEETLDSNNEWYCNVCKEHKRAQKIMSFCPDYLPKVLILTLKRFEFRQVNTANTIYGGYGGYGGQMMHREKIDTYVDFPLKGLNVRPYCQTPGAKANEEVPPETVEDDDGILYDLFAVCNHYGRMGFGHYTAVARDWQYPDDTLGDQWYMFDDHAVTAIPPKDVKTPSAYILFYRRRG